MLKEVVGEREIRTLRGGSQARLVRCSDGLDYVIKCPSNPQGPNVLANEMIAVSLMAAIGLPTAEWCMVRYCDGHSCKFEVGRSETFYAGQCDLHFASELAKPADGGRLFSFLPNLFIPRVENRRMFLGALIFDVWAGSTDPRQAVYVERKQSGIFEAVFIDNGHLFGGPNWKFSSNAGAALAMEREIYSGLFDSPVIEMWITEIGTKVIKLLPSLLKTVPQQWYKGDIGLLQDILVSRAESLQSLFWTELENIREPLRDSFRGSHEKSNVNPILPGRA